MTNPVVISYPLDLTGRSPDNLVIGETHGPCYPGSRVFVLSYGPFYAKSLVIRNKNTGVVLTPNVDYKAVQTFIEPTLKTGYLVCSIVQIEAPALGIELSCDYQVLGGDYSQSTSALDNLVDDLNNDNRAVRWGEIIGKPEAYPPTPHLHDIYDVFGWQYIVAAIEAVRQALLLGRGSNNDDIYAYVDLKHSQAIAAVNEVAGDLSAHLLDFNNPHRVTKEQIGLGLVGNYPLATPEIARLRLSHNTLMTPYLVAFANEYHTQDFNNPHQVTKAQTGLGNVDNYITATLQMALAGTDDQSFLTPFKAAAMIAAAMSATPPTPINPPVANVVSSSVLNMEVDDADFTSNQYTTTVYFADQSAQGTNPIATRAWTINGADAGTGTTKSKSITFTKPTGGPGSFTTVPVTVVLTVTDVNGLTNTVTKTFTFKVTLNVTPPPSLVHYLRINGLVLETDYGTTNLARYQSTLQAAVGASATHSFDLDIDPFWVSVPPIAWPDTGFGEAVKTDYIVNWLVKNDYTHSAHTYVNNVQNADGVQFTIPVESTYWVAARIDVTLTGLASGLSTTTTAYVDARTSPTYVAPTADFELSVDDSATGLTVTNPTYHDLTFIDRSVSNIPGVDIEEVIWDFGALGQKEEGSSNNAPGGWLHWLGRDGSSGSYQAFSPGSRTLTITLSARTATSPWVTRTRTYSLVNNAAAPPAPKAMFSKTYALYGPYNAPPAATGFRLTLNAGAGNNGTNNNGSIPGDPAYPIVSYQWTLTFGNGSTATLTGKTPPPYDISLVDTFPNRSVTISLKVTDSYGGTNTYTQTNQDATL